jgi:hypothetical protein
MLTLTEKGDENIVLIIIDDEKKKDIPNAKEFWKRLLGFTML